MKMFKRSQLQDLVYRAQMYFRILISKEETIKPEHGMALQINPSKYSKT
jgi:hypothetical protein